MAMNVVHLLGNLTRDPEMRSTQSGASVTNFRIAVNEKYTAKNGEKRENVLFIDCVAWNRTAELINEHFEKGSPILVEGKLQSREWEDKDHNKRVTVEVVVNRMHFIGSGNGKGGNGTGNGRGRDEGAARSSASGWGDAPSSGPEDDDVPF